MTKSLEYESVGEGMEGIEVQESEASLSEHVSKQVTQLQNEVEEWKNRVCSMSLKAKEEQALFNTEITRLNETQMELGTENDQLKAEISAMRTERDGYSQNLRDSIAKLEEKDRERADFQSVQKELQKQVYELQSREKRLKTKNEILDERLAAKSHAAESIQQNVAFYKSKVEEKNDTIKTLKCEARSRDQQLSSLKAEAKRKDQVIASLKADVERKSYEVESTKKEVSKVRGAQRTIASLERDVQCKSREIESIKHELLKAREAQRITDELTREVARYREAEERHRQQLQEARTRQGQAEQDRQRLLQMLESQVVHRRDPMGRDSFPNGEQIQQKFRECQDLAKEFFVDLAYLKSRKPNVEEHSVTFDDVFEPCTFLPMETAIAFVHTKKTQLASFLEDDHDPFHHPNSLVQLLATSSMQRIVQRHTCLDPEDILGNRHKPYVEWIEQACFEEDDNEIDSTYVEKYMKDVFDLHLYCRFSDPACFMHPNVGTTVKFYKNHHSQFLNPPFRQKAKAGDTVTVLFPGLYYSDPSSDENARPIIKALVVRFQESQRHNQWGILGGFAG